jgi:hypothetical protein
MSFDPLIQAMQDNPELVEELNAAKTPRERDAVLDAHGIEKPTMDSEFPDPAAGSSGDIDPLSFSLDLPSKQNRRPPTPSPFSKKPTI